MTSINETNYGSQTDLPATEISAAARACGHSSEPDDAGYEMSHSEKIPRCFLVTSGNSPEVLDLAKEAFDQMALFVEVAVVGNRGHTVGF